MELYWLFGTAFFYLNNSLLLIMFPVIAIFVFITNLKQNSLFITIWSLGFGGGPIFILFNMLKINYQNMFYFIAGVICIIISLICFYQLPKRNKKANELYGEILGFKKFLETAELKKVESLVYENPNYCFDVLPYLYIFGLINKWIKRFESFFVNSPEWYSGRNFNSRFSNIMKRTSLYASLLQQMAG